MQLLRTLLTLFLLLPLITALPTPQDDDSSWDSSWDASSWDDDSSWDSSSSPNSSTPTPPATHKSPSYHCPATNNGAGRAYPSHTYTSNQLSAAISAAAKQMRKKGEHWTPGRGEYPHYFSNSEKLPLQCGKNKAEYPIQVDGHVWGPGESVVNVPDRAIFEFAWKKGKLKVRKCGVIRHGPGRDFLNCGS